MSKKNDLKLTIIFASVIVTLALLFNGYSYMKGGSGLSDDKMSEKIEEGINAFVEKQQAEYEAAQAEANKPKEVTGDYTDDDAVLGDKNAPVTIVEFSDYECPFCKRHYTNTYPELKKKYIDTGKVKFIFRDFPLGFHDPLATKEAMSAECAREQGGDDAYFVYHDLLFENTNSNGKGLEESKLYDLAEEAGVNRAKFTACLDSEKYMDEVKKDAADGAEAGVTGTPAFLINNKLLTGAQPFSAFEQMIEAELSK